MIEDQAVFLQHNCSTLNFTYPLSPAIAKILAMV